MCNMYWTLFKVLLAFFVPVPVSPKIVRASQAENTWILTCSGFTSAFEEGKKLWKSPYIINLLQNYDVTEPAPRPPTPPRVARSDEVRARRSSIRPGDSRSD